MKQLVISKEDFMSNLIDENYLDGINSVHIAESEVIHYNFKDYIETISEDAYDDWDNQIWDSIKDTEEYKIVGSTEADPFENKISNESPIAKALLGKKAGTLVTVESPNGKYDIELVEIK